MYMAGSLFAININPSRNVVDVGNLLLRRTCGSVIVVLFPICSLARGKVLLETMGYLTVFDCRHGFRSTSKVISCRMPKSNKHP